MMPQAIRQCKLTGILILFLFLKTALVGASPFTAGSNQLKVVPVDQAFALSLTHDTSTLNAHWQISPQCYLYQAQLQIHLLTPDGKKISLLEADKLPSAQTIEDAYFGKQQIYAGSLNLNFPLMKYLPSLTQAAIQIDYQGCTHAGFCYPPVTKWVDLKIHQHQIQDVRLLDTAPTFSAATSSPPHRTLAMPNVPDLAEVKNAHHIPTAMLTFYLLGLLLAFTPCVLPMIPILFGVIVGQKHLNSRKAFWLSLCYVLSMAGTYAAAGVLAAVLGKNLQASLQQPIVITAFVLLLAYLGLSQMGVVRINLPHQFRLKEILHKLHAKQESGTYVGAAVMGILATLISSPCVTAPLIGALSYISQSGNILLGASALLALGLGMGTILLIAGTLGGKYLPQTGPWMHAVNHAFAAIMFGLCLYLLDRIMHGPILLAMWGIWCLFVAWCMGTFHTRATWSGRLGMVPFLYAFLLFWGTWQGESNPLKPFTFNPWQPAKEAGVSLLSATTIGTPTEWATVQAAAQRQEQPILLVFYADWCVSCQHIEHDVLANPDVHEALKSWRVVQANITAYHHDNQLLLQKFALIGPPALLFFDKNGTELTQFRIVGEISPTEFLTQLALIKKTMNSV